MTQLGYNDIVGMQIVPLATIPVGLYVADAVTGKIFCHPKTAEEFMNKIRMQIDDQDGERSFPV